MHKYWARVMWPVKKLRLEGASARGRGGALGAAPRGRGRGGASAGARAAAVGGAPAAAARPALGADSALLDVPHSYFFFWAFSAALVILPVVTSLKFTLCNNKQSLPFCTPSSGSYDMRQLCVTSKRSRRIMRDEVS